MKKALSLILALLFVLVLFAACGDTGNTDETDPPAVTSAGDASSPVSAETTYAAPELMDLTGYTYRMLVIGNTLWMPLYFSESGKETGDVMNDALYRREMKLEELYHCDIEVTVDSKANTTLANCVSSGTDLCETVFINGVNSMVAAKSGYLLDLADVEGLSLDSPWWDQRIQKEYLLGDHLFTLEGDISVREDLRTMTVIYNKKIYNDFGYNTTYGKPYDMVANGEWTYERMCEMIKDKSYNLDSSETLDGSDFWGMLSERSAPYYFFLGSGLKTVTNDNGVITSHINDENIYNFMEKTMQMVSNHDIMIVNNGKYFSSSEQWTAAVNMVVSDQCLFRSTTLSSANGLRDMKSDYGILPVPNAGGGSTEYYCYVSGSNHTPLTMPSNVKDQDKAILITEALAYYSMFSGNPAVSSLRDSFYEELATARLARSADDKNMLEIVFASKTYDVDQAAAITGLESAIYSLTSSGSSSGLGTLFTSYGKLAQKNIENFIEAIESKNK